jgi:hypothetical protein
MRLGHRRFSDARNARVGRVGLWAALFAVFCQIVLPAGHDVIELLAGEHCPGLALPISGHGHHSDAGSPARTVDAHSSQPAAHDQGQTCPIFQSLTYLAPLGSSGPPPLPVPAFARSHHSLADWAGLLPAAASFSRPFPRAPPAHA